MDYYILTPLLFILRIVESFSQFYLMIVISNTKTNMKNILISSFILTILFEILKIRIPQYLTSITACSLSIVIIIFVCKINYKKAVISFLLTSLIVAIMDCIISISLVKLCGFSTFSELSQTESVMTLGRVIIVSFTFVIAFILKFVRKEKSKKTIADIKNSVNLVTLIITFFLLMPNFAIILYYHDKKTLPLIMIIINILAIIATFIISVFNTQRGIKLIQAEEELITEKTYNSTLQHLVDSLRTFKHDYNNTLHTINGYIFTQDWNGLTDFIRDVIKETKNITALDRLNPELFRNPSLFGLVTAKFEYARKSDVTMNFEIYADLDNMDIKTYDFTRTLGILLDNAIEASAGSEKKIVNFYVVEKNGKVTIEISNTFSDTGLKIDDINKKGVSSKGKNRGLGLYKVKDILSKYPKIKHETSASSGMFLQRIIIDKIKVINT